MNIVSKLLCALALSNLQAAASRATPHQTAQVFRPIGLAGASPAAAATQAPLTRAAALTAELRAPTMPVADMPAGEAHALGARAMDGLVSVSSSGPEAPEPPQAPELRHRPNPLQPSRPKPQGPNRPQGGPPREPSAASRIFFGSLAGIGLGALAAASSNPWVIGGVGSILGTALGTAIGFFGFLPRNPANESMFVLISAPLGALAGLAGGAWMALNYTPGMDVWLLTGAAAGAAAGVLVHNILRM